MLCNKVEKSKRDEYHHYIDLVIFILKRKQMKLFFYLLTAATITLGFQCVWFVNPLGQESCQQSLSHQDTPNLLHVWDNDSPFGSTIADSDDHCPDKRLLSLKWGHLSRTQGSVYTHDLCPGSEISRQSCLGTTIMGPILSQTVFGSSNPVQGQISGASHNSLVTPGHKAPGFDITYRTSIHSHHRLHQTN